MDPNTDHFTEPTPDYSREEKEKARKRKKEKIKSQ